MELPADILNPLHAVDFGQDCPTPASRPVKRHTEVGLQQRVWKVLASGDDKELVQLLNDQGPAAAKRLLEAFNDNGLAAIHIVAKQGDLETLKIILEYEVDTKAFDKCAGCTALHLAVRGGHEAVATLLVQEAASIVDLTDRKGQTPLHYATSTGSLKLCELLLDAEADPEVSDLEGNCPLQLACGNEVLEKLYGGYVDDLQQLLANLKIVEKCD